MEASTAAPGERDVSFVVYVPRPHVVWVQELYVSGSQRKQGVGSWLMSEAVGTAAVALQAYRGTPAEKWYKNRALAEPRGRGRVFDAPTNGATQVILEAERFHEVPHWQALAPQRWDAWTGMPEELRQYMAHAVAAAHAAHGVTLGDAWSSLATPGARILIIEHNTDPGRETTRRAKQRRRDS